ncbi:Serine/threonine protein phosphatase [Paragonimus heterotremus]|uniref:protein-serine/threonine phosphatase n=1 Tax=Paragonimus heterotremus TaxID=100268 RepID=A0A8J4SMT2_9TREM|nr:Serine/threonine protein phosphatase [Paragonimus heterotremus]
MGAYMAKPDTTKQSSHGYTEWLAFGVSSMQGWRMQQEDAHNCEPEFDRSRYASLFAVYDGHGGAEVARYCATYLPEFLQKLPAYDKGDPAEALRQLFLDFDASLTTPEARAILQSLTEKDDTAGDNLASDSNEDEDESDSEISALRAEANQPLESVLERYGGEDALPSSIKKLLDYRRRNKVAVIPPRTFPCLPWQTTNRMTRRTINKKQSTDGIEHKTDSEVLPHSSKESNGDESAVKTTESEGDSEQTVDKVVEPEDDDDSDDENVELDEEDLEDEEDDEEDSDDDEDDDDDSEDGEEEEDDDEDEGVENLRLGIPSALQDQDDNEPGVDSGTTACVALLLPVNGVVKLYVANAGDSRAVLCRGAAAVDLSVDHKPEDEDEKSRITAAGGTVTRDGRVNGGLNLSRALGDHSYKQVKGLPLSDQMITPVPDITQFDLIPGSDEFLVIACDGVWNSMTSQEVVNFVYDRLHPSSNSIEEEKTEKASETDPEEMACRLSKICEELFEHCLAPNTDGDGTGCDNMTCIIVHFHNLDSLIKHSSVGEVTNSHMLVDSRKRTASTEAEIRPDANGVQNSNDTDSAPSETKRSRGGIFTGSDAMTVLANGDST